MGQTWVKPGQKGSNRAGWSEYIKYTYVSTQNFLKNSNLIFFKVNCGHQRSNWGQTRLIGVKLGRLIEIYRIYICSDSELSQELKFNILQGQLGSSEVELGSNSSNRGQIGLVGRNISNIHMFWLRISSAIEIVNYLRSNQVIKKASKAVYQFHHSTSFGKRQYSELTNFEDSSEFSRNIRKWIYSKFAKK